MTTGRLCPVTLRGVRRLRWAWLRLNAANTVTLSAQSAASTRSTAAQLMIQHGFNEKELKGYQIPYDMLMKVFNAPPLLPDEPSEEHDGASTALTVDGEEPLFEDPYGHLLPAAALDPDERELLFTKYVLVVPSLAMQRIVHSAWRSCRYVDFFLDTGYLGVSDHYIDSVVAQILDDRVPAAQAVADARLDCALTVQCRARIRLAFVRLGVIRHEKRRLSTLKVCFLHWRRRKWHWAVLRHRRKFHTWRVWAKREVRQRLVFRTCFWPWHVWNRYVNQRIFARGKARFLKRVWIVYRKRHILLQWRKYAARIVRNKAAIREVRGLCRTTQYVFSHCTSCPAS